MLLRFVFVILPYFVACVPVKTGEDSTKIAQCRANCLDKHAKFDPESRSKALYSCSQDRNCFMCWESCELLYKNERVWGSMCSSPQLCFPGCQTACQYHKQGYEGNYESIKQYKWIFPSQLIFKKVDDGVRVDWNAPVSRKRVKTGAVLYTLLVSVHRNDVVGGWTHVIHTTELNSTIPSSMVGDSNDIKVVAVTAEGVLAEKTTTYSKYKELISDGPGSIETEVANSGAKDTWKAKLLAMVYDNQYGGAEATITWPALKSYGAAKYEVTWQVKHNSMEITGHLYTEANVVALSLWPDAFYEVQIRCISSKEEDVISQVLSVDTKDITAPTIRPIIQECKGCVRLEVFAGFAAGVVLIVLLIVVTGLVRCLMGRRRQQQGQKNTLKRQDAIRRKVTTVKVNGVTGSISEMVSEKERKESKKSSISKVCGRALASYKLSQKSFGLPSAHSPIGESTMELLDEDDDVFPAYNVPTTEPWKPAYAYL